MTDRLAEIQARLDAATPGKWLLEVAGREFWVQTCTLDSDAPVELVVASVYEAPDATFIANAPTDIAYLLERVRRLEVVEEAARQFVTTEMAVRKAVASGTLGGWVAAMKNRDPAFAALAAALTQGQSE